MELNHSSPGGRGVVLTKATTGTNENELGPSVHLACLPGQLQKTSHLGGK